MKVKHDYSAQINDAETKLMVKPLSAMERARLLVQIGGWYSEMDP